MKSLNDGSACAINDGGHSSQDFSPDYSIPKRSQESLDEERFLGFVNRDVGSCAYERFLLASHIGRVAAVLDGDLVPPYEIEIQPTSTCNLKCKHCFGRYCRKLPNKIGVEEMRIIAKRIYDFRSNGYKVESVKFCGTTGEPLVNPATVHGIKIFRDLGMKLTLFTNGLWLDKYSGEGRKYFDYVLDANKINLSLDAGSEETFENLKGAHGFARTLDGLEELVNARHFRKSKLHVVVSYVIGRQNYAEISKATKLVKEIGADELRFRVDFTDIGSVRELASGINEKLDEVQGFEDENFKVVFAYSEDEIKNDNTVFESKGRKCFNHNFWASIGSDCELYFCGHRTHGDVVSLGNVLETPLSELWGGKFRLEQVAALPDNHCRVCSPCSLRTNELMSFLSGIGADRTWELCQKHLCKSSPVSLGGK